MTTLSRPEHEFPTIVSLGAPGSPTALLGVWRAGADDVDQPTTFVVAQDVDNVPMSPAAARELAAALTAMADYAERDAKVKS